MYYWVRKQRSSGNLNKRKKRHKLLESTDVLLATRCSIRYLLVGLFIQLSVLCNDYNHGEKIQVCMGRLYLNVPNVLI